LKKKKKKKINVKNGYTAYTDRERGLEKFLKRKEIEKWKLSGVLTFEV